MLVIYDIETDASQAKNSVHLITIMCIVNKKRDDRLCHPRTSLCAKGTK
jgi:hypothetical protein